MIHLNSVFAQASSLPSWLPYTMPIIGVLGLMFTYERWIVDNRVKAQKAELETSLAREKQQREYSEQKAAEAYENADLAYEMSEKILDSIKKQDISSHDSVRLHQILNKLKRYKSHNKEMSDYKTAARELKKCSNSLFEKAVKRAIKDCKNQTPEFQKHFFGKHRQKMKNFKAEVIRYVDWVYDCLYISGHPDNNPLKKFVQKPTLSSSIPYLVAITYIRDYGDWEKLTPEQVGYLKAMFDELLRQLPTEF